MTDVLKTMTRVFLASGLLLIGTAAYAQQPENADEASTACDHVFSKGAGAAQIQYCVNAHGNMMSFMSPVGAESIRVGAVTDGYVVCSSTGVHGHDGGAAGESLWGPTLLISGPSSTGVGYARTTFDGRIRLEHTFKMDSNEADVTVTVKVINITKLPLVNVQYKRFSDFDAGGSFNNRWTRSTDEVEALNEGTFHGISLNAISFATPHAATISLSNLTDCDDHASAANAAFVDSGAQIVYSLGDIGPLKSKTVKFVYKRK